MHGLSVSMADVTTGGPGLVTVGNVYRGGSGTGRSGAWISSDGVTWSLANEQIDAIAVAAVTAGGPGLVAVGMASETPERSPLNETWMGAVWTSIDGVTWSRVPPQPEVFGGPGMQGLGTVATGGPGLVAVGGGPGEALTVFTSTDGITWSRLDTGTLGGRGPDRDALAPLRRRPYVSVAAPRRSSTHASPNPSSRSAHDAMTT